MMDIEKRFLQISIDENGKDSTMYFQTILKSFAIDLQGSIFGVASSPFLVNQTIQINVNNYEIDVALFQLLIRFM